MLMMVRWPRLVAMGVVLGLAGRVGAAATDGFPLPAWSVSQVSSAMSKGHPLHLVATGEVAVAYERVYTALMRTNVLLDVASTYLHDLPAGAKTNLLITPLPTPGHYTVSWNGERADVFDLWRQTDTNTYFEGGFIITGKRYFGAFESVLNLRLRRTESGQAGFRADVLVYPHNGLIRFIFNNLLSVEDYFRRTVNEMGAEIRRLCTSLCRAHTGPAVAPVNSKQ